MFVLISYGKKLAHSGSLPYHFFERQEMPASFGTSFISLEAIPNESGDGASRPLFNTLAAFCLWEATSNKNNTIPSGLFAKGI